MPSSSRSARPMISSAGCGWPSAPPRYTTGGWGEVACPLQGGDDHGRRAVGLEAAVELAQRLGDVGRGVVLLPGERAAPHQGLVVQLGVLPAGEGHRGGCVLGHAEGVHVAAEVEAVVLRGRHQPVRRVEVADRLAHGAEVHRALGGPGIGLGSQRRVPVPAQGDEHGVGQSGMDGHRRGLERGGGGGAAHEDADVVGDVGDAQVGGDLLGAHEPRRGDDAVDVGGRAARRR